MHYVEWRKALVKCFFMYYSIARAGVAATRVAKMAISQGCHTRRVFLLYMCNHIYYRYLHAKFYKFWPSKKPSFFHLKQASIVFRSHCTVHTHRSVFRYVHFLHVYVFSLLAPQRHRRRGHTPRHGPRPRRRVLRERLLGMFRVRDSNPDQTPSLWQRGGRISAGGVERGLFYSARILAAIHAIL